MGLSLKSLKKKISTKSVAKVLGVGATVAGALGVPGASVAGDKLTDYGNKDKNKKLAASMQQTYMTPAITAPTTSLSLAELRDAEAYGAAGANDGKSSNNLLLVAVAIGGIALLAFGARRSRG